MDSIDIVNLALNMLGINSIASFDEENNNAQLCKKFFPVCRDRVLRDHSWSFAAASVELAQLNERSLDPALQFVCSVPGDCIAVREVLPGIKYRPWGRKIMVSSLPATLIYTCRVEDSSLFDPTFCEALQYNLAVEIGMSNTRNASLIQMYRQEYERTLALARSIDSNENRFAYQNSKRTSHWIHARGAGGNAVEQSAGQPINWVKGTEGKQV